MMTGDQFTPEEQAIIQRLQNAPQSYLRPAAYDAIRARMIEALDAPPPTIPTAPSPFPITVILLGVLGILAVIIVVVIAAANPGEPPQVVLPPPSQTAVPATISPTIEKTIETTAETTPEAAPTATLPSYLVVEGPVTAIQDNVLIVMEIPIQVAPDDPLLSLLQVGDLVRAEGVYDTTTLTVTLIADHLTYVGDTLNVNPDTSETWRDDGSCSNPPPDWAPANGWRQRCGGTSPGTTNPGGNTPGRGNSNNGNNNNNSGRGQGGKP
ncbi:MAG: hypothetical protein K8I60_06425 [Anaerolineae bacterium]|nr:hypothetical protein [Anaerolineae bacterium]